MELQAGEYVEDEEGDMQGGFEEDEAPESMSFADGEAQYLEEEKRRQDLRFAFILLVVFISIASWCLFCIVIFEVQSPNVL
jgi:hypothetical protein